MNDIKTVLARVLVAEVTGNEMMVNWEMMTEN